MACKIPENVTFSFCEQLWFSFGTEELMSFSYPYASRCARNIPDFSTESPTFQETGQSEAIWVSWLP